MNQEKQNLKSIQFCRHVKTRYLCASPRYHASPVCLLAGWRDQKFAVKIRNATMIRVTNSEGTE